MPLEIKDLRSVEACGGCAGAVSGFGYECSGCGIWACAQCYQDKTFRELHLHTGPTVAPVLIVAPEKLAQASQNDLVLVISTNPKAASTDPQPTCSLHSPKQATVPEQNSDVCPSCGWTRADTSSDSKLAKLTKRGEPFTWIDYQRTSAGAVRSHSVFPQTLLQTQTRSFLRIQKDRGPCDLIQGEAWETLRLQYKARLYKAAFAEPQSAVLQSAIDKTKRHGDRASNQASVEDLRNNWKPPSALMLNDDEVSGTTVGELVQECVGDGSRATQLIGQRKVKWNGQAVTDRSRNLDTKDFLNNEASLEVGDQTVKVTLKQPEFNDSQLKAKNDFLSKFPKDRRTDKPKISNIEGDMLVEARVNGDVEGSYVIYRRRINRDGKKISDAAEEFVQEQSLGERNLMNEEAKARRPIFPDDVFSNLMKPRLLEGSQCDYCERLQGDFTLPQRYRYWQSSHKVPREFVSLDLLQKIEAAGGIEKYMETWLDNPATELREELERLCNEERASRNAPAGKAAKAKKENASADDLKAAVESAVDDLLAQGDTIGSLAVAIATGTKLAKQNMASEKNDLKAAVNEELKRRALAGELETGETVKGNTTFTRKKAT